jgi:hypothetical protein
MTMNPRPIQLITVALTLLAGVPVTGMAQSMAAANLLARFEREQQLGRAGDDILAALQSREEKVSRPRIDSLLVGLERIARDTRRSSAKRSDAADLLASAGDTAAVRPRSDVALLLVKLYRETNDEEVHSAILQSLPGQANQGPALALLRQVAEKDGAEESFTGESETAARLLLSSRDGTAQVRDINARNTARNPRTAAMIRYWVSSRAGSQHRLP